MSNRLRAGLAMLHLLATTLLGATAACAALVAAWIGVLAQGGGTIPLSIILAPILGLVIAITWCVRFAVRTVLPNLIQDLHEDAKHARGECPNGSR